MRTLFLLKFWNTSRFLALYLLYFVLPTAVENSLSLSLSYVLNCKQLLRTLSLVMYLMTSSCWALYPVLYIELTAAVGHSIPCYNWINCSCCALYPLLRIELLAAIEHSVPCCVLNYQSPFLLTLLLWSLLCCYRDTEEVSGEFISKSEVLQWLQTYIPFRKGNSNTTGRDRSLHHGSGYPQRPEIIPRTGEIRSRTVHGGK
jgi:hypothetical protein